MENADGIWGRLYFMLMFTHVLSFRIVHVLSRLLSSTRVIPICGYMRSPD